MLNDRVLNFKSFRPKLLKQVCTGLRSQLMPFQEHLTHPRAGRPSPFEVFLGFVPSVAFGVAP